MSAKAWLRFNEGLVVLFTVQTVFCLTPGPGQDLASSLIYLTAISHLALVLACLAAVAGARAERANEAS